MRYNDYSGGYMASKRERAFRKVRVVIDVVNIILSIAVVGITVYTFMDVQQDAYFSGDFLSGSADKCHNRRKACDFG